MIISSKSAPSTTVTICVASTADARQDLLVHASHARGRVLQAAALDVLADALQDQAHTLLDLLVVEPRFAHGRAS